MHNMGIASKIGVIALPVIAPALSKMSLRIVTSRSIHQLNLQDWCQVCDPEHDLLMHPRLLEAAEASLGAGTAGARASGCDTHFWYLLAYRG